MAGRRLFFALWPDVTVGDAIVAAADAAAARAGTGGRPTPRENIHLTLLFLGSLAPEAEAHAVRTATLLAPRVPAFELVLDEVGSFRRSGVLWVGTRRVPDALGRLWRGLSEPLAAIAGAHARRDLAPHVTCFRDIECPLREEPIAPIRWSVAGFTLVCSSLHGRPPPSSDPARGLETGPKVGSRYHVVSHWALQTASA